METEMKDVLFEVIKIYGDDSDFTTTCVSLESALDWAKTEIEEAETEDCDVKYVCITEKKLYNNGVFGEFEGGYFKSWKYNPQTKKFEKENGNGNQ